MYLHARNRWYTKLARKAVALLSVALSVTMAPQASAQENYPERLVRIVVPFGAGNSYDHTVRYIAEQLQKLTSQSFIVEPKQGAIGNIAAAHVARSPADGYTVFLAANSTHAANTHLFKELPFDPVADFEPVTTLVKVPQVLVVSPTLGVSSVQELIDLVKKNPGKYNYGSSSATGRVAAESFNQMAGLNAVHVGYKTTAQAVVDLASGQLHYMFTDAGAGITHARNGKVQALGVTSGNRLDAAADIPAIKEAGLPDYEFVAWLGFAVPANTPATVVQKLSDLTNQVLKMPETEKFLADLYIQTYPGNPESLRQLIASDTKRWGELIKAAGIEPQ